ncbi:hypothetical protein D3C74_144150 [compost metagenome]
MSNKEIEQLNKAMKQTSDKRLYERYLAVRLRLEGHTFDEIGKFLSRARQTISMYWQAYQTQGLSGLAMNHSPGQPPKLTEEQRHRLAAMLEQHVPADRGFEARYTWTLPLVAEWIQREFGVTMSVRGISAMLKRMRFSFTKATYTLAHANEEAQAYFKKHTFAQLKKQVETEKIEHLLFEDESMIRSYQALQYNWFPRGKQRKVPT